MWWQRFLPLSGTRYDFIWKTLSGKGQLQSEGRQTLLCFGFLLCLKICLQFVANWIKGKCQHWLKTPLARIARKKKGFFQCSFIFLKLAHLQTLKSAYSRHLFEAETATVSLLLCSCILPASTVSKSSQASSVCSTEISALVPTTADFLLLPAPTYLSAADWWSPLFLAISCCPLLDCVTYWQSNLFQSDLL